VGDFSNMNGGYCPPHHSHQIGIDIDAIVPDVEKRDVAIEKQIVAFLRQHYLEIKTIFIYYGDRPAFRDALINEPELPDHRSVKRVIQSHIEHKGHFHIRSKRKTAN
jgi:murein endopeptidase